jgi:hypothetical protein
MGSTHGNPVIQAALRARIHYLDELKIFLVDLFGAITVH